ncbi:MAG TPA: hypothetical protein VK789_33345 [Bryobacteraceae bacterium]|nr:hypothetical protein [Bryobacteraceae bacterium]
MSWIRANSDKLFLGAFLPVLLFFVIQRVDSGDGLRHLGHILSSNRPALGEPRWILFPVLLFAVIKPFVVVGAVQTTAQATRIFGFFNALCSFGYLVCLRRWLMDLSPLRRTAVLLLAGGSYVFLSLATDTIEPTPAVLIAVAGITFARFRVGLSDIARVTIAAASIMLAALIYQGILFGFFFLPAVFPVPVLATRRAVLRVLGLALCAPLVTVALLTWSGDTPRNSLRRFLKGEANDAASSEYSKPSARSLAGVAIVGPAYAFASIPERRGLAGSARLLRQWTTAAEGIRGLAAWACMAIAIAGAIVLLIVRKQAALLIAFIGMMALPAIRISQYSYVKYYALLPLLVVLIVPKLGIRFIYPALLGALLLVSNLWQIRLQRVQFDAVQTQAARELYPRVPEGSCFLSSGWGLPVPGWPGDSLAWMHILAGGSAQSQESLAKMNSQQLRGRLRKLFCSCPAVVTDTFIQPNAPSLQEQLSSYHIADLPLPEILVSEPKPAAVFRSSKFTAYRFSSDDQHRACEALD